MANLPLNDDAFAEQFVHFAPAYDHSDDTDNPYLNYAHQQQIKLAHDPSDIGAGLALCVRDYWKTARHPGAIASWQQDPSPFLLHQHVLVEDNDSVCNTGITPVWRRKTFDDIAMRSFEHARAALQAMDQWPSMDDPDEQRIMRASSLLCRFSPLQIHEFLHFEGSSLRTRANFLFYDASYRSYDLEINHKTGRIIDITHTSHDIYPKTLHHIFPQWLGSYMPIIGSKPMAAAYDLEHAPIDL